MTDYQHNQLMGVLKSINRQLNELNKNLEKTSADRQTKSRVEDCLFHIYRNISPRTSAEGVAAVHYYLGNLWETLYGKEEKPSWMI